jgi:hypothetical protein
LTELGEFDFITVDAYKTSQGVWKWMRINGNVPDSMIPAGNGECLGFDNNGDLSAFDCAKPRRIICE